MEAGDRPISRSYDRAVTQTVSQTLPMTYLPYAKTTLALVAAPVLAAPAAFLPPLALAIGATFALLRTFLAGSRRRVIARTGRLG